MVDRHETMYVAGKRRTEYDATAPRGGLAPSVAARSIGGQAPMRVQEYEVFGLRVPDLDRLILTQQERTALRRAAVILERVREARTSRHPVDWYMGEEDDADLVFGWRICDELAREGSIDV